MARSKLSAALVVAIFMGFSTGLAQAVQTKESKEHGWLGIGIKEVTPEAVKQLRLPEESGAWIATVFPATPAAEAGLKVDDVIVRLDSTKIEDITQLLRKLREYPVGSKVEVRILRNAQPIDTTMVLGPKTIFPSVLSNKMDRDRETEEWFRKAREEEWDEWVTEILDLQLFLRSYESPLGLVFEPLKDRTLRIIKVREGTPAKRAGFQVEDVITHVNGKRLDGTTVVPLLEKSSGSTRRKFLQLATGKIVQDSSSRSKVVYIRLIRKGVQKESLIVAE